MRGRCSISSVYISISNDKMLMKTVTKASGRSCFYKRKEDAACYQW